MVFQSKFIRSCFPHQFAFLEHTLNDAVGRQTSSMQHKGQHLGTGKPFLHHSYKKDWSWEQRPYIFFQTLNFTLKTSTENTITNTLKSLHDSFIACIKNDRFRKKQYIFGVQYLYFKLVQSTDYSIPTEQCKFRELSIILYHG